MEALRILFSHFCGQQHTWVLDGVALPFCQRCTGLYVGAFCAIVLIFAMRPRPGAFLYWLHGAMMLTMFPFGFHFVQHGGVLRTLTGAFFAFGMVYFFALIPLSFRIGWRAINLSAYLLLLGLAISLLLIAVRWGGAHIAYLLAAFGTAGFFGLAVLAASNLILLPRICHMLVSRPAPSLE